MSFLITVQPNNHKFTCNKGETIITAAIRAGINLPYSCKNGACSSCKGRIISGSITYNQYQESALSKQEKDLGFSLFCCAIPNSDVVIETHIMSHHITNLASKKILVRIAKLYKISKNIIIMSLQLPTNYHLQYRAGQYGKFILNNNKSHNYSIANAPHKKEYLTFHIRHILSDIFTNQIFSTAKERQILYFEGPKGTFFLREDKLNKSIILLALGIGFASIKAIIEQLEYNQSKQKITLYWVGNYEHDLYMNNLCLNWKHSFSNFKYIPIIFNTISQNQQIDIINFVYQIITDDFPDLSDYQVYVCGISRIVKFLHHNFITKCHLVKHEFYSQILCDSQFD